MRKIITMLVLGVMLATAGTAQAQIYRPQNRSGYTHRSPFDQPARGRGYNGFEFFNNHSMYFGLKIGFNASAVRSEASALNGTGVASGLNTGMALGFYLSPYHPVSLETGLYYSEKGGKSEGAAGKFTYDLNYLELPLVIKYKFFTSPDVAIEPFAGGYAAVGVGGKIKDYNNREAFSSFDDGFFKRGDAGLRLGCGISYRMVNLEASYDLGLANIGQDDFADTHNGCFTLSAGITF